MKPQHTPISPATLAAMASYARTVPYEQRIAVSVPSFPAYPVPHGAGVVAWICASTIGTVIALACLAAAWIGGAA